MLTYAIISAMAFVVSATDKSTNVVADAPLVTTLVLPGNKGMKTSGNLLVAKLYGEEEVRYWDWNNLKAKPNITIALRPYVTTVLGNGMIVECVFLGITEETKKEDRIVSKMKYLQEIKKNGGKGLAIRNISGDEFSSIDYGKEKEWFISGLEHSQNGKVLGVWQAEELTVTNRFDDRGIRVGIVDQQTHSVQWIATTRADDKNKRMHPDMELKAAISNDGKRFVLVGTSGKGGWICMMDADKKAVLWEHWGVAGTMGFTSVALLPDSKKVYTGDKGGWIFCFDGDTGDHLPIGDTSIRGSYIAASPNGELLAAPSAKGEGLSIYDAESGCVLLHVKTIGSFYDLAFSSDNKCLAVGNENGIEIYDLSSAHGKPERGEKTSTENKAAATSAASPQRQTLPATLSGHIGWVNSVASSPDGKNLASGSTDNTVKIWNIATGKASATLKGHTGAVNFVKFSRDGQTLASASEDKSIKIWDAASGKNINTFYGHTDAVRSIAFSPDNKTLASCSYDKTIKLWDMATGKNTATFTGHSGHVTSVDYSPDGKTLASGCWDAEIKLWDIETGKNTATLKGHSATNGGVSCITFSPDGKTLASAGFDCTIKLWDVATGKNIATIDGGFMHFFTFVAYSPDGKTLISDGYGNTIDIWDPTTRRKKGALNGHSDNVHSVAFSPDGKTLASGSYDRTIMLWDLRLTGK